jgi:hypothetical protein
MDGVRRTALAVGDPSFPDVPPNVAGGRIARGIFMVAPSWRSCRTIHAASFDMLRENGTS